jgi:hypothetical protein
MSDGHRINTPPNIEMPRAPQGNGERQNETHSHQDSSPPDLKHNAAQLFNHDWQNAHANERKGNLLTMLLGTQHGESTQHSQSTQHGESSQHLQTFSPRTTSTPANYANQSLGNLINFAKEHKDFHKFQNHSENFWQNVSRMSEVRILKSHSGEPHFASRYGELLDKFTRQGGRLETFLRSLPNNEREVFAARYQMEKTFGAGKLFVGNGITLDKHGNFGVRAFLTNNNKAVALPLNFAASMHESGMLGAGASLFAGGRILFNAESASLLGISLAFYQNLGASVNLKDAAVYTLFQNFIAEANEISVMRQPLNLFTTDASARKNNESVIVGALINGALPSVDKNSRVFDKIDLEAFSKGESSSRPGFSAGAAGAMLGAAIGCLVPMAGAVAGRATGLAGSIVVGTAERGLRSLSVNLLISDAVTNAVQTLLDATQGIFLAGSAQSFLPAASPLEDLQMNLLNRRRNAFLTA